MLNGTSESRAETQKCTPYIYGEHILDLQLCALFAPPHT